MLVMFCTYIYAYVLHVCEHGHEVGEIHVVEHVEAREVQDAVHVGGVDEVEQLERRPQPRPAPIHVRTLSTSNLQVVGHALHHLPSTQTQRQTSCNVSQERWQIGSVPGSCPGNKYYFFPLELVPDQSTFEKHLAHVVRNST